MNDCGIEDHLERNFLFTIVIRSLCDVKCTWDHFQRLGCGFGRCRSFFNPVSWPSSISKNFLCNCILIIISAENPSITKFEVNWFDWAFEGCLNLIFWQWSEIIRNLDRRPHAHKKNLPTKRYEPSTCSHSKILFPQSRFRQNLLKNYHSTTTVQLSA